MARAVLTMLIVLGAFVAVAGRAAGQEATPPIVATPGTGCDVTPRDEADLIALNASPAAATPGAASPIATTPMEMPMGEPVDAATLNALNETLRQVIACAEAGDIARLLALYSDAYVRNVALAPEPVPIIPAQPRPAAPVPNETPSAVTGLVPRVEIAGKLPDRRIAALVSAEGVENTREIVIFIQERGRWVIDEIHSVLPEGPLGGDLPFPVQAAAAAAAAALGVDPEAVTVVSYERMEWPDTSLGCPKEGEFYAQVITPGYRVILSVNGQELEYHTDEIDRAVRCDAG